MKKIAYTWMQLREASSGQGQLKRHCWWANREREDLFLLVNQVLSIAVIAVISSLTHKRGERVNPELY